VFVTAAGFEDKSTSSVLADGLKAWASVVVPHTTAVWFIVDYVLPRVCKQRSYSMLALSDEALVAFLSSKQEVQAIGVSAMQVDIRTRRVYQRCLSGVWEARTIEGRTSACHFVLRLHGDPELRTPTLHKAIQIMCGEQLFGHTWGASSKVSQSQDSV
jgi:hypothetical protein